MNANSRSIAFPKLGDFSLTMIVLVVAVAIPFFVHLIPYSGSVPIGAKLLLMFFAPLVAIILFRFQVAFVAAILAPIANYVLTEQPVLELSLLLSLELGLFTAFVYFLLQSKILRWIAAPLAYLGAKLFSSLVIGWLPLEMTSTEFWLTSVSNGLPGILILLAINLLALQLWKNKI
ncbi:MAG: hypothetical protein OEQ53_15880 [Saprospiraceae bacterium]|nr:hypothetical protein [Saprospiraceae bacterium]